MLTPGADPVRKVSIIPRGHALGVTHSAPDADRFNYDERELLARIRVAIAGRAAEEIVFGDRTTGAESDIQQLTQVAHAMIARWGMSDELGPVALPDPEQPGVLVAAAPSVSESTHREIDREVRRIVAGAREDAVRLLREERSRLDRLAATLLEQETLDQIAAYRAAGLEPPTRPAPFPVAA
jgi:cell division protease FtsH